MKIILLEDIYKVGLAGDVVKVANGFARNYLLPKNKAILAKSGNLKQIESIKARAEAKKLQEYDNLKNIAEQLKNDTLEFIRKADENGHLFGSVSERDIIEHYNNKGIKLQRTMVELESHLKQVGEFEVNLAVANDINIPIKVIISKEKDS